MEMNIGRAKWTIAKFKSLGARAVTVTGGGEPLMYPRIEEMLRTFTDFGIEIGLVTNGTLLHHMSPEALRLLTWCRISWSDERAFSPENAMQIDAAVSGAPSVDWAFSYVVGKEPRPENVEAVVRFAEEHRFTHVRLVADLRDPSSVSFDSIRSRLDGIDQGVIYQARTSPVQSSKCAIGYVKPLVAPDFRIYLCCGVQYAFDPMPLDLPDELCIGDDPDAIWGGDKKAFDVRCTRCYYRSYNDVLVPLTHRIKHEKFL